MYIRSHDYNFNTHILGSSNVIRCINRFECPVLSSRHGVRPPSSSYLTLFHFFSGIVHHSFMITFLNGSADNSGTRLQIRCEILRCTSTLANIRCDVRSFPLPSIICPFPHPLFNVSHCSLSLILTSMKDS
jgi:hypothetical protein